METEHPDPEKWWRHRRRQAYISLAGIIAIGVAVVVVDIPEGSAPVVQSIIWALAAIVAVYSGGASVVDALSKVRK